MSQPTGPGNPFQLLFSELEHSEPSLPETFRHIYPADWHLPTVESRPYIYSNFATSRDGRISYKIKGLEGGGDITGFNSHDRWLMGLLRVRADAILNGDVTVNVEPESIWTAEAVYPGDAAAFRTLRQEEGYKPKPIQVILSYEGKVNIEGACFQSAHSHIVVATTAAGAAYLAGVKCAAQVDVHCLGQEAVDLPKLIQLLYSEYGVRNLLCEGGAHVMANMLQSRLIDEEFVTLCPSLVGANTSDRRPSYVEGVAWRPDNAPYSKPIALLRANDHLFLRTKCRYVI